MIEQRRYARTPLNSPVSFAVKGTTEGQAGVARDISIGGMFLETATAAAFGAQVIVHVSLPGAKGPVAVNLPAVVRWLGDDGMGLQFGLIGAVETHLITEIGRRFALANAR